MPGRSKRGFAVMSPEKQRAIASKGGQAAHYKGTAHEFTPEEAREAGRLGGKTVGEDRAHMAAIGRKGGQRSTSRARRTISPKSTEGRGQLPSQEVSSRATDLLRADHRTINRLFHQQEMNWSHNEEERSLLSQIYAALEVHAQLEEELFYPAVKAKVDESMRVRIDKGMGEHHQIKDLITHLRQMTETDASFASMIRQLRESVQNHVLKEEQEILSAAEEQCGEDLLQLGAEIQRRKQALTLNAAVGPSSLRYSDQESFSDPSPPREPLPEASPENSVHDMQRFDNSE